MDIKPGYATTEFWVALLTNVLAVFAVVWTLAGKELDTTPLAALIPAIAALAAGISSALYSHSRAKVKVAALDGRAIIETTSAVRDD